MKPGHIPASDAIILWDDSGPSGSSVTEVLVRDQHEFEPGDWGSRLDNARGATDQDWLDGSWDKSPLGIFLLLSVTEGFTSEEIKILALREFAKVAGQEAWTSGLLRLLGSDADDDHHHVDD